MTTTAPPLPPIIPRQPIPVPSRSPLVRNWTIITAVVLLAVAALAVANSTVTTNSVAETPKPTDRTMCDPGRAIAYPNGDNGAAVYVNAPGPDVVTVDVIADGGYDFRLVQQVTKRSSGAQFDFGNTWGTYSITVMTDRYGICGVPVPEVGK